MRNPFYRAGISMTGTFLLLLASGCSKTEEKEPEPVVPVRTTAVEKSSIRRIVQAQGILFPRDQAAVVPKITAPVREFYVNRGDHVSKGQVLAVLENRDIAAAEMEAKGNLDQAEANFRITTTASLPDEIAKSQAEVTAGKEVLDAAQKVLESRKGLFEQGALPRRQLDEASVAYAQARSSYDVALRHLESLQKIGQGEAVKAAQAQVDSARGKLQGTSAMVSYARITSPISGVVADRPYYAGETAAAGTPLLTVVDISSIVARANVPVDQLPHVRLGNTATIAARESELELHGKVTVVSPALDPNSTTAEIWIVAENPGERMKPGMTVQVSILAETVIDTLVIPVEAILPAQDGSTIVRVAGSDSVAHDRQIEAGIREAGKVQVLKGLTAGEQVITSGGYGLQDNAKIKVSAGEEEPSQSEEGKKADRDKKEPTGK